MFPGYNHRTSLGATGSKGLKQSVKDVGAELHQISKPSQGDEAEVSLSLHVWQDPEVTIEQLQDILLEHLEGEALSVDDLKSKLPVQYFISWEKIRQALALLENHKLVNFVSRAR